MEPHGLVVVRLGSGIGSKNQMLGYILNQMLYTDSGVSSISDDDLKKAAGVGIVQVNKFSINKKIYRACIKRDIEQLKNVLTQAVRPLHTCPSRVRVLSIICVR